MNPLDLYPLEAYGEETLDVNGVAVELGMVVVGVGGIHNLFRICKIPLVSVWIQWFGSAAGRIF